MGDSIVLKDLWSNNINQKYDHTDGDHQPTEESQIGLFQFVTGFSIRKHPKGLNIGYQ
jgi:hypothetical protein